MKLATLIISLFLAVTYYSQTKQFDTLIIFGQKYSLERSKVYYTSNEDNALNVIRTQHKGPSKLVEIKLFPKSDIIQEHFDASGNPSAINFSKSKEKINYRLYHFSDTIKIDKNLPDIRIKSSGQVFQISHAQFIATNDTCSEVLSISIAEDSEPILTKLYWHVKDIKVKSVYLTSMYYMDKNRNLNYLPIQFCLLFD